MNAVATLRQNPKFNSFYWLLKREFWENRGGFFRAPAIAGSIVAGLYALLGILGSIVGHDRIHVNEITSDASSDDLARMVGNVGDGVMLVGIALAVGIMAVVIFFYCLGALFDERKDRSVLFWKSMPVSDTQTVLSKVAWALVLAPLVALCVGVGIGVVMWLVTALTMNVNGLPASMAMFTHSHPLRIIGNVLVALPVQVAWALPSVGWLLLCSAWAQSKPFLWAVLLPALVCTVISMMGILGIDLPHQTIWHVLFQRPVLSLVPGSFMSHGGDFGIVIHDGDVRNTLESIPLARSWHAFATLDLWIGVAVGIGFVGAAIYLRRWRELAD